ncbi:MAG: hypothetical protein ACYCPW_09975 [Nitrososphaerales archaeon]
MSEYKTKIMLGAVLAVIIAIGLAGATIALAPQTGVSTQSQQSSQNTSLSSSSSAVLGAQSVLIVQLTDPPIVPVGTTSLNLTYTAMVLLVTEPATTSTTTSSASSSSTTTSSASSSSTSSATTTSTTTSKSTSQGSLVNSQTITITPTGGSATINLLKLQNISQTLASANLPNGSIIYSISFVVSSINIDVNGVISPVILATGGTTLLVAMVTPAEVQGTVAVLLSLNPTIINTPTGYQMIPSSVGVIRPSSEITGQDHQVGHTQQLTEQDQNEINHATGQLTASLVSLSVSGSTSTITIQVSNTGNASARLVLIGLNGNFTDLSCVSTSTTSTSTSTTSGTQDNLGDSVHQDQHDCQSQNQVVFVPSVTSTSTTSTSTSATTTTTAITTTTQTSSSSTSSAACTTGNLALVNSAEGGNGHNHLVIAPGQCITLTFSGTISDGESGNVLVPSTLSGQTYNIHLIASNNAESMLTCMPPFSQTSCTATSNQGGKGD